MKTLIALVLLQLTLASTALGKSPNIVVFLTDDMGWGDLACYGHPVIKSPNLDKFAKENTDVLK